jgi:hypothetical protein
MGFLSICVGAVAAWLLRNSGHDWLFWAAVAATVGAFWSFGIMHNYAIESAKKREGFTGGFYDLTSQDAAAAPDWATRVNILCSILIMMLFVFGAYSRLTG